MSCDIATPDMPRVFVRPYFHRYTSTKEFLHQDGEPDFDWLSHDACLGVKWKMI